MIGKLIAVVLATVLWVVLFRRFADVLAITNLIAAGRPAYMAAGAAITCLTALLRAVRASMAVANRSDTQLMSISIVHNAVTALLPMKLGEFALPVLLARTGHMQVAEGFGLLLLLRILDLFALGLVGSLALFLAFLGRDSTTAFSSLAVFVALCIAALGGLAAWTCTVPGAERAPGTKVSLPHRLLAPLRKLDRTRLAKLGCLSILVWLSLFSAFYCATLSLDRSARVVDAAAAGAAASMAFAVPASGIANVGPFQLAWVWMAALLGIPSDQALSASLLAHGTVLAVTLVLGLVATVPLWPALRGSPTTGLGPQQ